MRGEKTRFEQLLPVTPDGLEAKVKEIGALARGREIKNALDLFRLVFLCMAEGKSFGGTAALLELSGICAISEKAALARLQKCGEWLGRLCERMRRNNEAIIEPPEWLGGRAYRGKQGMERLLGRGSGFVFRFGAKRFDVYNRRGGRGRRKDAVLRMGGGAQTAAVPRVAENEGSGGERP
jgi:hypothetical protein